MAKWNGNLSEGEHPARGRILSSLTDDLRMWFAGGAFVISAIVGGAMLLHALGIFQYETRISVLEAHVSTIRDSVKSIDDSVREIRNALLGKRRPE
jgi:hypothetical protein